jgi:hypothetical protein
MSPARRKPAADSGAAETGTATEAGQGSQTSEATETCPWCSAKVSASAATCPSCGASLREATEGDILGVTQIDPAAVSRASRVKPGRIATWLGADNPDEASSLGGHVEPPSKEVREEMLRLELAAIDAEIEAKKQAAEAQKLVPDELADTDAPEAKPS